METEVVGTMIRLYCNKQHGQSSLCESCAALLAYATQRIADCPDGEGKSFCSVCTIHCYRPDMRAQIRRVMRFSGPRMLLCHPVVAIRHLLCSLGS